MFDRARERQRRLDVEALEHAVAGDVGVDDRRDAGILEAPAEFVGGHRPRSRAQPSTATGPSVASMPTAIRPG